MIRREPDNLVEGLVTTPLGDVEHKVASSRALAIGIAAASAGAGLLHLAYAPEHLATQTSQGMFFLVVAWFQIAASALIIFGRAPRWAMFTIVAVNAAVLVVWIVSRTAGIDGVVEQVGMPDALAGIFEVIVIGGATLLAMGWAGPMISETALGASVGVSLAGVVALVSVALVPALGGGHSEAAGHGNSATSAAKAHDDSMATDEHPHDESSTHSMATDEMATDEHPQGDTVEVAGANMTNTTHGHTGSTMNTTGGTTNTNHGHNAGTTATTPGHNGETTTTTTGGHHVAPPPGEDWATIRRTTLIGGASAAKQASVSAASRDFLEMNLRTRSSFLGNLGEADREARIDAFASWQIDRAIDVEHGDHAVGNRVDGPSTWVATSPDDSVTLMHQLHAAAANVTLYPTAQDAMNAGYFQVTSWIPGIGAHYLKASYVSTFDAAKPSILLYNGNKPSSVIVGVSHAVVSPEAPEGFAGTNDAWHIHPSLCLLGAFVVGSDATSEASCSSVGATKGTGFGSNSKLWMMHLWQVPNWWSQWGLFSSESTSISVERTDVGT